MILFKIATLHYNQKDRKKEYFRTRITFICYAFPVFETAWKSDSEILSHLVYEKLIHNKFASNALFIYIYKYFYKIYFLFL